MKKYVPIAFPFIFCTVAFSQNFSCGNTQVSLEDEGEYEQNSMHIVAKHKKRETSLWLNSIDYYNGRCVTDKYGRKKILINAYCGGSGCHAKTYILIDARTLMVELLPIQMKNNSSTVERLLGKPIE